MKSLFVFAVVLMMIACTNVEKYYFVYADGEWVQVEEDPRPDNSLDNKDAESIVENGDNENVAVNDDGEIVVEEDLEPDSDSFLDEENPEEIITEDDAENTDDGSVVPDDDFCDNPCVFLYTPYDGYLGKDRDNGEMMRIWIVTNGCRCEAQMILEYGYRESFFGYTFPLTADETSNTLNTGNTSRDIIFTVFSDGKERYFEETQ